jgi:hypothetical protein
MRVAINKAVEEGQKREPLGGTPTKRPDTNSMSEVCTISPLTSAKARSNYCMKLPVEVGFQNTLRPIRAESNRPGALLILLGYAVKLHGLAQLEHAN